MFLNFNLIEYITDYYISSIDSIGLSSESGNEENVSVSATTSKKERLQANLH